MYERGIGTLCAELYVAWAYYYDSKNNFSQTEVIYQKGFNAGAEPKEDLLLSYKQFTFSMSQRLLQNDEPSRRKSKTSFTEQRCALTSLKMQSKGKVGSMRTGIAVQNYLPGAIGQDIKPHYATNNLAVYQGETANSTCMNQSVAQSLVNSNRDRENIFEPAPWSNKNKNYRRGPLFGIPHDLSFDIPMDSSDQIINSKVDNLCKGIQLSLNHKRCNYPQRQFVIAACDDDKPSGVPMYNKICLYCRAPTQDFSPEEFRGFQYFKRCAISCEFFEKYEKIWGNGSHVTIRLHPYHIREYKCSIAEKTLNFKNIGENQTDNSIENPQRNEELSMEELRFHRWKNGRIKRKYNVI